MKLKSLCLLGVALLTLSAIPPDPPSKAFAAPNAIQATATTPDWQQHVYEVRVRAYSSDPRSYGQAVYPGGTGVSIGEGRILTAAHLADHCQAGYVTEAKIDGQWVKGRLSIVPGRDLATLTVERELPGVTIREPEYGEPVTVFGLRSGVLQGGLCSNTEQVSLEREASGVIQGDSGGGVFGADGCLVGTIRGINPTESRVVYFTASSACRTPPSPASVTFAARSCPGGVCQVQR